MDELSKHRAKKEGKSTPKILMEAVEGEVEDAEMMVIIVKGKDGTVEPYWSHASQLEVLGLLKCAEHKVIDLMTE